MCLTDSLRLTGATSFNFCVVNWKIQPDSRLWGGFKNSLTHPLSVFLINLEHRKAFSYLDCSGCVAVSCQQSSEGLLLVSRWQQLLLMRWRVHCSSCSMLSSHWSFYHLNHFLWLILFICLVNSFMPFSQQKMWCVIKAADLKQCSPQQALWLIDIEFYSLLRCVFVAFCNE